MAGVASSVVDLIGETPVVELARIGRGFDGRIVAKLEYFNPGFSKKDRIARRLIEDAELTGELAPGQTVVELTSGNTGTGLAIVCAIAGHPFVAVMSRGNSRERARMMRALGAEVILVDQAAGGINGQVSGADLALVESRAQELAQERRAFRADQFGREGNRLAHRDGTFHELWTQTRGGIDAFCDYVGTGGTFAGISMGLKALRPSIACYVVEPAGAAVLAGMPVLDERHQIQGGGYAMTDLPMLKGVAIDGFIQVRDADAVEVSQRLACEEGIFAGYSSGAVVWAAMHLLGGAHRGQTIAVVLSDSGLKYLSTGLWQDDEVDAGAPREPAS